MKSTLTIRRYFVLAAIMVTAAFGDTFLSVGMKEIGPVSVHHLSSLLAAFRVPWIWGGIALLIAFFASYLTALSWADLTFVLPATAFGYVIIALLSAFWLHETISPGRWFGIVLITAGVGFVTRGPSYTHVHRHSETPVTDETVAYRPTVAPVGAGQIEGRSA